MAETTSSALTSILTTESTLTTDDVFTGTRLVAVVGGIVVCAFVLFVLLAIGIVYCKYRTKSTKITDDCESGTYGEFFAMSTMNARKNATAARTGSDKSEHPNTTEVTIHRDLSKERASKLDGEKDVDKNSRITELDPIYQETDPAQSRNLAPLTEDKSSHPYKPLRKNGSFSKKGVDNIAYDPPEDDDAGYDSVDNVQVLLVDEPDSEHIYDDPGKINKNGEDKKFDEHKC